jgi:uncharacterized OB-fold protein
VPVTVFDPPILPLETPETGGYFAGLRVGELRVQACRACGRFRHPPAFRCPWCHSPEREWRAVSGRGRIWSFIVPHPPLLPGFTELAPYNVIVVEIDEDPTIRLTGNLVLRPGGRPDEIDPATISVGEAVRAVFHMVEDVGLIQWVRAG